MARRYKKLPSEVLDCDIADFNINYYSMIEGLKAEEKEHRKAKNKAQARRL